MPTTIAFLLGLLLIQSNVAGQVPLLVDEDVNIPWQLPVHTDLERSQALVGLHVRAERIYFAGLTLPDYDLAHSSESSKIPRTFVAALNSNGQSLWSVTDPEPYLSAVQFAVAEDGTALILAGRGPQGLAFVRRLSPIDGQVLWQVDLPNAPDKTVAAMPDLAVSADGSRISLALSQAGYEGSAYVTRQWLYALDGQGALLFASEQPELFETQDLELSGDGQRLFVATQSFFSGGYRCLDAGSGALLWEQSGAQFVPTRLESSYDGRQLYAARIAPNCSAATLVRAHDGDGQELWTHAEPGCGDALLLDEGLGRVFLNLVDGSLAASTVALDSTSGNRLWMQAHGIQTAQSFSPSSRMAYAPSQDRLYVVFDGVIGPGSANGLWSAALGASSGATQWSRFDPIPDAGAFAYLADLGLLPSSALVLGLPRVYPSQDRDALVRALDGGNGALLFEHEPSVEFGPVRARALGANFTAPAVAWEDLVFAALETDSALLSVLAMEPGTGATRWNFSLAGGNFEASGPQRGIRHLFVSAVNRVLCARNEQPGLGETEVLGLYADTGFVKFRRSNPLLGEFCDSALSANGARAYFAARLGQPGPQGQLRAGLLALDSASGNTLFAETWETGGDQAELLAVAVAPIDGRISLLGNRGNSAGPAQRVALLIRDGLSGAKLLDREYDAQSLGLGAGWELRGIDLVFEPNGTRLYALVWARQGASAQLLVLQLTPQDGQLLQASPVPLPGGSFPLGAQLVSGVNHLAVCVDLVDSSGIRQAYALGYAYGDPQVRYARTFSQSDGTHLALAAARASEDGLRLCLGLEATVARLSVLDFATGSELWFAEAGALGTASIASPAAPLDLGQSAFLAAGGQDQKGALLGCLPQALLSGPNALGLSAGGIHVLTLTHAASAAGQLYLLLGSASGTQPGLSVDGLWLPLNPDAYLTASLVSANQGAFQHTLGLLDGQGQARMEIHLPAGLSPSLAGTQIAHAALVFGSAGTVEFVSAATTVLLMP